VRTGVAASRAPLENRSAWHCGIAADTCGAAGPKDARALVNLTPIAGLERHLHRCQGDARLALRTVREAVLERNREGRTA